MASILMDQSPEDQFLHWCQNMERKQEKQARRMKKLQSKKELFAQIIPKVISHKYANGIISYMMIHDQVAILGLLQKRKKKVEEKKNLRCSI